ncbi:vacuole effluxer Atg22 like-domain-containing protein [Sordaria brevicollis]|uniref:Autophagy-related protein n=1 Tax=Sordaria brevicollis TaxID=83679 RepID=A0AAE0UA49_SORBR|nr:vacuole effluxer Atg22 like-domain-containing protein [Sordaria brevicollis]
MAPPQQHQQQHNVTNHVSRPSTSAYYNNEVDEAEEDLDWVESLRPPPAPRLFSRSSYASYASTKASRTSTKRSFLSRTTSSCFEADDERSDTVSEFVDWFTNSIHMSSGRMSPGGRGHAVGNGGPDDNSDGGYPYDDYDTDGRESDLPPPRYPGDDTRPTSQKELAGWYAYAFAAEVYVICGIGSFIPILLESLARENGVLLSDRSKPCGSSSDRHATAAEGQCVVYVLGLEINTASFAMYTFSVSVLLQALLVVSISCAADHGNFRKKLLLAFAWIGSTCVMAYIFISKSTYLIGALLAIISNTSFGASFVLLNSFLPLLVRHHPEIDHVGNYGSPGYATTEDDDDEDDEYREDSVRNSTTALLGSRTYDEGEPLSRVQTTEELTSRELELSTQISAKGIGTGYIAGLFLQCVAIGILIVLKNTTWSQRIVLCVIGAWWAIFTIPAAMWLRPRPGPPLPSKSNTRGLRALFHYTIYAWKSLFRTVQLARRLVDIVLFLAGWFLLSDAIATTSSTAILFAKTQLHMEPWALGMINVISTASGIIGAFSWSFISRKLRLKAHQTILACIALFELIPLYGLMGYLPFVKAWGVGGLQQPWEMYPLAAIYGFVLGGLSGYCRSLYGELIPPGSEAAFYALYAITDKGSSVFGPAIVGAIIDASGEIRPAFWFLAAVVGTPGLFIYFINVERGRTEGEALAEIIEGFKQNGLGGDGFEGNGNGFNGYGGLADDRRGSDASRAILGRYDDEDDE